MDFGALDITAIGGALAAIAKAFHSSSKVDSIQEDRVKSKQSYDERFASVEVKIAQCEKRLDEGNERFILLDKRLDEINGTLKELKGMFAMYLQMREKESAL